MKLFDGIGRAEEHQIKRNSLEVDPREIVVSQYPNSISDYDIIWYVTVIDL